MAVLNRFLLFHELFSEEDEFQYEAAMVRMTNMFGFITDPVIRYVPRVCGHREAVNEMIDDKFDYFPAHFRVSRHVFEVLLGYVRPRIRSKYVGGHLPLPVDKQLLVFLCYIGNQQSMREVSQLFGISPSTVHSVVMKVLDTLLDLKDRVRIF